MIGFFNTQDVGNDIGQKKDQMIEILNGIEIGFFLNLSVDGVYFRVKLQWFFFILFSQSIHQYDVQNEEDDKHKALINDLSLFQKEILILRKIVLKLA